MMGSVDTEAEEVGDDSSALAHVAGGGSDHRFCLHFNWNSIYNTHVGVRSDDIRIRNNDDRTRSAADRIHHHLYDA